MIHILAMLFHLSVSLSLMKYIISVCHKMEHEFMKYEPSITKYIKNNTTSYSIVIPKTSSFIYNFYQVVHETWFYLLFFLLTRERERERVLSIENDEVKWHWRYRETAWYAWVEREHILVSWDRLCHSKHHSHRRRSYIFLSARYPHNITTLVGKIKEDWGEYYLFLLVWRWSVWSF